MLDLTNVASELVSNNALVFIQVFSLFKITEMICKNAEFVNALDNMVLDIFFGWVCNRVYEITEINKFKRWVMQ